MRQRCKVCGYRDKFDFYIDDCIWKKVVPKKFQNRVVCMSCFDDFAKKKGISYEGYVHAFHFAGDADSFELQVRQR